MKSMIFGAAGILVSAGALPAFAADMTIAEPPAETPIVETAAGVYDWGGFYVGVNAGYARTNLNSRGPAPAIDRSLDDFALGAYAGYKIPPYYDSLIGKLIVHGRTRVECMMRLRRVLDEFVVDGIKTTLPLFQDLVANQDIANGDYDIHWLENYLASTTDA